MQGQCGQSPDQSADCRQNRIDSPSNPSNRRLFRLQSLRSPDYFGKRGIVRAEFSCVEMRKLQMLAQLNANLPKNGYRVSLGGALEHAVVRSTKEAREGGLP